MKSAAPAERPLTASEWKRVAVIAAGMMGHSYSIGSIFSYVGIMAVDLGWADDADAAGFVASLLSSALTVARLPTASLWGHAAERYGTGRALRASCAAMALGNALFGLCTTLAAALLVRGVLLGACNGFVTLMSPMAAEAAGDARQADVMAKVFAAAGAMALLLSLIHI